MPKASPTKAPDWKAGPQRPLVGITCDVIPHNGTDRAAAPLSYAAAVARAGGLPVLLQPDADRASDFVRRLDALVLTGGDDPRTEPFGVPSHPKITPLAPARQAFESALIETIERRRPELPVLGVCLGMQMMALHAGGRLDQYMPETHEHHARHWDAQHPVVAENGSDLTGAVWSKHKQVIADPGKMTVCARSDDGLIEAVQDPMRPFYLGVQWHPERTEQDAIGQDLFRKLIAAASG